MNSVINCWNEPSKADYIFVGPIVFILIVNYLSFRKIAKGLFLLCPLLGTTYIFTLFPPQHPPWLKLTFSYSTTILTSTQVLFCIKKSYSQFMEKWRPRQYNCYMELFDSLSEGIKESTC
ncbi:hypothetical protein T08_317 [Trichinella sp. T8]|nr:hypothetical protein T08_317 [Trichinella sp. T8]